MSDKPTFQWTHGSELHCNVGDATMYVGPQKKYVDGKQVLTGRYVWSIHVTVGYRSTGLTGDADDAIQAQENVEKMYAPLLLIMDHASFVPEKLEGTHDDGDRQVDMCVHDRYGNVDFCALCSRSDAPCLHTVREVRQALAVLRRFGLARTGAT